MRAGCIGTARTVGPGSLGRYSEKSGKDIPDANPVGVVRHIQGFGRLCRAGAATDRGHGAPAYDSPPDFCRRRWRGPARTRPAILANPDSCAANGTPCRRTYGRITPGMGVPGWPDWSIEPYRSCDTVT